MTARSNQEKARVGLLGVGLMGSAMAHRLLDRGIGVIAWDRDSEQLRALEGRGGESTEGPSQVVSGAGVVIRARQNESSEMRLFAPCTS